MISDLETLSWINKYRADPLLPDDSRLAQRLLNRRTLVSSRQFDAATLGGIVSHYPVSVSRANIMVHLGVFALEVGDCGLAVDRFRAAAEDYNKVSDFHCLAAALWLLGMAQREMRQHRLAFARWKESRDLMIDLHAESERLKRIEWTAGADHNDPGMKWYGERITGMTADMLRTPHEMFEWAYSGPDAKKSTLFSPPKSGPGSAPAPKPSVYQFKRNYDNSASTMGDNAVKIRQRIDNLLEAGANPRVPDLLHYLEALDQGPPGEEFCEVHAYCATLVDFFPALKQEAIRHLNTARSASPPQSRSRMITTWMLGLLLISEPDRRVEAIRSMEASITCARRLETAADRENNTTLRKWYHWHVEAMQQVLAEHVQATL